MNWVRGDSLGHGAFATVNIVVPANGSTFFPSPVAVKSSVSHNAGLLKHEKEMLYRLGSSPYIINCFGHDHTVENGEEFYNFLEQAAGGSLADQVKKHGGSLPEPFVRRCTRSIVEGLRHIHDHGSVHCDVKLQNVLVFDNGEVAKMMKQVSKNEESNRAHQRFPYNKTSKTSVVKTCLKSSITCKYWINGNCMYGDKCRNLHSWSVSERTSIGMKTPVKEDNIIPSRLIWWTPPFEGFVKINCDGAFTMHGNKAGAGGVVRDWRGEFIFGFSSGLENYSVLMAELEAIKIGIEIAIYKGYKNLMVESDSKVAIDIITSLVVQQRNDDTSQSQNDMCSIIEISKMANKIHWNHVFREVNSAADGLAKHGLSLCPELGVKIFEDPPYFIESHLYLDRVGKIYHR